MPTKPNKPQVTRTLVPKGTHIARVIGFIYIGTIETEWLGQKKKMQKIRLTWEFPEELHKFNDEEKPLVLSEEFTLSMGKKSNLRPIVEGIIGTSLTDEEAYNFDAEQLVGMACLVTVAHKISKTKTEFARIVSTSPLMKGQICKPAFNKSKILNYTDSWDKEYFDKLPSFIREKMMTSEEYRGMFNITIPPENGEFEGDDSIPF